MRQRTASAAWRSDRFITYRSTQTVASCAGESPGLPSRGYQAVKSSSLHRPPRQSRIHIAVVAGSGDPHGQRRDLGSGVRLEGHIELLENLARTFQGA